MYLISCLQSLSRWVKRMDDSLRLGGTCGECPDTGMRVPYQWAGFMRHPRDLASSATSVFHGTIFELGNIFPLTLRQGTHRNALWLHTCKRIIKLFFVAGEKRKDQFCLVAARMRIPVHECGGESPRFGKGCEHDEYCKCV
jgi:hypothetical protein